MNHIPISVDWPTKVISIPKSYLTLITGTLYELDTDQFRLDLKALEDDEEGMPFPVTHTHNTEVTVAGITYARTVEIINGYSITFEDGQYSVRLTGSNNNFFDVENGILNQNQVQIIPTNSAGLQTVETTEGTAKEALQILENKFEIEVSTGIMKLYNDSGTSVIKQWQLKDKDGNAIVVTTGVPTYRGEVAL